MCVVYCFISAADPQPPSISVKMSNKVIAMCSVSHSCPSFPPTFLWSRPGVVKHRSKRLNDWKWETQSTLTFNPLPADFKIPLNCTVKYRGGKEAMNSTRIWRKIGVWPKYPFSFCLVNESHVTYFMSEKCNILQPPPVSTRHRGRTTTVLSGMRTEILLDQ